MRLNLLKSLSKTSPERKADTRSSNSPLSSRAPPAKTFRCLCHLSFSRCSFNWGWKGEVIQGHRQTASSPLRCAPRVWLPLPWTCFLPGTMLPFSKMLHSPHLTWSPPSWELFLSSMESARLLFYLPESQEHPPSHSLFLHLVPRQPQLTMDSIRALRSSSSFLLLMASRSCWASKKACKNVSKMPKNSSGCILLSCSPKCVSALANCKRHRWKHDEPKPTVNFQLSPEQDAGL